MAVGARSVDGGGANGAGESMIDSGAVYVFGY
jgi:hypothetical protein